MNRYTKKTAFLLTLFISFCLPLDTIARRLFDVNYSCVKAEKIEQIFGTDATLYLYFFLFFFFSKHEYTSSNIWTSLFVVRN